MAIMDSVKTAMAVLEAIGKTGDVGVSELSRLLGEPKSTVQRCLETLHEGGWIAPADLSGRRRWNVTTKVLTLGRSLELVTILREAARPEMEKLRAETDETIHLMVREGGHVVLIERLESPLPVRTVRQIGARAPLHVASNGKAILASLPKADREAYIAGKLEPFTSRSLLLPEALRADLELTARRGFALSDGELDLEVRAVAAAILSANDRPVGAMSISCPAQRLPPERVEQFGLLVAAAARRVSGRLADR
jgi:IclR family transcriptional regulator, acetate operon repressor